MLKVLTPLLIFVSFCSFAIGQDASAPAPAAEPVTAEVVDGIRLANWNIQTLTVPGERVFADALETELRTEADFQRLRQVRDAIAADVFVLQEISSLRALAKIFPTSEWQLCFSGQYDADLAGLGPYYDRQYLSGIAPTCVSDGDDTLLPDPPAGELRRQYLAFAIRKDSKASLRSITDLPSLSKPGEDAQGDGVIVRGVRWGLSAVINTPGGGIRILNVHLKSGCFDSYLTNMWWLNQAEWSPNGMRDHACTTLARQLPELRAWVLDAKPGNLPFVIVGDFNRRIDAERNDNKSPDFLPILDGSATPEDTTDNSQLTYLPEGPLSKKACWPEDDGSAYEDSIEFMVFGPGDRPANWEESYQKVRYVDLAELGGTSLTQATDSPHLSDHCPSFVTIP
jgi:hypothetical protein